MKTLTGGLRVEKSNLKSLSLFTVLNQKSPVNIYCEKYGIYISNNTKLVDVSGLSDINPIYENKENKECNFEVVYNQYLDARSLCDSGSLWKFTDLKVMENSVDCGCIGDEITQSNLPRYKYCEVLYRGLKLQNITSSTDLSDLSDIYTIKGSIDIRSTNFQNLSFLEKFKIQNINNPGVVPKISFNLQDNPNMTRLALPAFEKVQNLELNMLQLFNFENLHPDFCLTYDEIVMFMTTQVTFLNLHAKICEGSVLKFLNGTLLEMPNLQVCIFESMAKLPSDCGAIIGDVIVDAGDELSFKKFIVLKHLFGSMTIQNTNLTTVDVFYDLGHIIHLGPGPFLQIISNKKMKRFAYGMNRLANLYVRSDENRMAIFQDNHPDFSKSFDGECKFMDPRTFPWPESE
ncbi:hypothetical protein CAEBREN_32202 [Caenorhabditis brenneri]|uniref:Receptor L-domain domain-containing protein n=1 Tax=Caenorhabditis brenneri TaxID=135651 RepID=G0PFC0_CAEBE|nr:hypothetical protein CAEBREN_32202 [Caenorhabditis brenneri]